MNKKLLTIVGICAALLLVVYIGLNFFLGSVVTAGVNRFGPKITQTKVELASASISPLSGSGTLTGLTVGNPKGWTAESAFYLRKIRIVVKPFSIFGDHIVVNEIFIDQPDFIYETKIIASNIGDLLKNIEAATGGAAKDGQPTAKNGKPIKFEVKHFRMQNGTVIVGFGPTALKLPMPAIELNDLGTKEGGITPDQLAFAVMRSVTPSIIAATAQAAGQIGTTSGAAALEGVKKTGAAIKGLFGGKK
ncbi:MAG: hypothetical protein H7343_20835 [Undibacterium sp.]|nr:hypothetical protein [Opitutaceae bacterium]